MTAALEKIGLSRRFSARAVASEVDLRLEPEARHAKLALKLSPRAVILDRGKVAHDRTSRGVTGRPPASA
jgi:hypothetical protein